LLDAWRAQRFVLVTSPALLAELKNTLSYPRLRRKYSITDEQVDRFADALASQGYLVDGEANVSGSGIRDPNDEIILACAVDGEANVIVSSDLDLLTLGSYRDIPILNPREVLAYLDKS
jgi:putative PIN family toxin of toxin-antitoxin system